MIQIIGVILVTIVLQSLELLDFSDRIYHFNSTSDRCCDTWFYNSYG